MSLKTDLAKLLNVSKMYFMFIKGPPTNDSINWKSIMECLPRGLVQALTIVDLNRR